MLPYKQFWQSGWPRCHSLSSPWSNSDAHKRPLLHFPPVCSRLFFTEILWLSLAVWESWPHHHYLAILLIRWLTSALQWSTVDASGLKTKEKWWCRGIQGMCNKVTECSVKPHKEVFHFWSFSWSIGSSRSLVLSKICQQPLTKLSWYLESWSQEDATNCIKCITLFSRHFTVWKKSFGRHQTLYFTGEKTLTCWWHKMKSLRCCSLQLHFKG